MKKRIYIRNIFYIVLLLCFKADLFGQSYGNSIYNPKKGYMSVAAEACYVVRNESAFDISSMRYIGKIEISPYNGFSFIGYAGAADLHFIYPKGSVSPDFNGSVEFCFGGGIKKNLLTIQSAGIKFFGSVGYLKIWSFGKVESVLNNQLSEIDVKYNWYEYWAGLVTVINFGNTDLYLGLESKSYEWKQVFTKDSYTSGFMSQLFFGVDFKLPYNLAINLQGKLIEEKTVLIGVSQTGDFK